MTSKILAKLKLEAFLKLRTAFCNLDQLCEQSMI